MRTSVHIPVKDEASNHHSSSGQLGGRPINDKKNRKEMSKVKNVTSNHR